MAEDCGGYYKLVAADCIFDLAIPPKTATSIKYGFA